MQRFSLQTGVMPSVGELVVAKTTIIMSQKPFELALVIDTQPKLQVSGFVIVLIDNKKRTIHHGWLRKLP